MGNTKTKLGDGLDSELVFICVIACYAEVNPTLIVHPYQAQQTSGFLS